MKRERKEVAENGQCFRPQVIVGQSVVRREAGGIGPPQESTSDSGSTQAAQSQRQLGVRRTSGTAAPHARHVQSDCRPVEQSRKPFLSRRPSQARHRLRCASRQADTAAEWDRPVLMEIRNSPRPAATTHR
jgi:hypothetical protein